MFKELRRNASLIQILLVLLIVLSGSYVFQMIWGIFREFSNIITIVLISWLVSFLLDPIVELIQKYTKTTKILATAFSYILLTILIVTVGFVYIPLISSQIILLVNVAPILFSKLPVFISNLNGPLISQFERTILFIPSIAQFFFSAFIVLTLSFYFIIDQKKINDEFFRLIPSGWHGNMKFIEKVINDTFVSFFRVQFFYGVSTAIVTWITLIAFSSGFAVSVGFFSGLFAVIPLLGPLLAILLPVMVSMLNDPVRAALVGVVLFLTQQIIFNVIGPKLLGKAMSLHPAIILISLLIGLKFAGAMGAIFAIPLLGIGVEMIRKFGIRIIGVVNKTNTDNGK